MKPLLILGGTGFVGRALCEALAREQPGLRLRVPTRRDAHAQRVRALPTVEVLHADIHDDAQLAALLQGCGAVVNLVAILQGSPQAFQRVHVELPRRLAQACRAAGVPRLVHVSALGVDSAASNYLRSKLEGEAVLKAAGLALTLLRPSVIFGAHDRFMNLFADLQGLAPVLPLAGAGARMQPVWVGDVATAITHCLAEPATAGLTVECAGPEVFTLAQLARLAGRWSGHERPQIALPDWAARLQVGALALLPGEPLMSADNLKSLAVPNVAGGVLPGLVSLGIQPRALESVAPAYLAARHQRTELDRHRAQRG